MTCTECGSGRIASVSAKLADGCDITIGTHDHSGDLPDDMCIGEDSLLYFDYCLTCGTIQGDFPLEETSIEIDD